MIFHFQTTNCTFFEEDQAYFEKRFHPLQKLFGWEAGDEDSINIHVHLKKLKSHSGDRFEASCDVTSPHHGKFHAHVECDDIKKCADELKAKLKPQIAKFHDKK